MKTSAPYNTRFGWAALLLVAAVLPAAAQRGGPGGRDSADASGFTIIETRNIFDASRLPRIIRTNRTEVVRLPPPPPQPQIESITCVGTMNYEKGPYAFFEGSRAAYEQVLRVSNRIAGLTVTGIEPQGVRVTTGSNELSVPVGGQLTQERGGPWRVVTNQQVASLGTRPSIFGAFGSVSSRDSSTRSSGGGGGLFGRNRGGGGRSSRNGEAGAAAAPGAGTTPASGDSAPGPGGNPSDALQNIIQRALDERAAADSTRGSPPPPPDAPGGFDPGEQ
jgi:hypothetical protein